MADIKEDTFLGSAAMPQPDGTQKALEVHIFPEAMRGTGEGHRPFASVPSSTMTNGTAAGATVTGVDGSAIKLKYKDGEKNRRAAERADRALRDRQRPTSRPARLSR